MNTQSEMTIYQTCYQVCDSDDRYRFCLATAYFWSSVDMLDLIFVVSQNLGPFGLSDGAAGSTRDSVANQSLTLQLTL